MDNNDLRHMMYESALHELTKDCHGIDVLMSGEPFNIVKEIIVENVDSTVDALQPTTYTEITLRIMADKLLGPWRYHA